MGALPATWRRLLWHAVLAAAVPLTAAGTWLLLQGTGAGAPTGRYELLDHRLARQPNDARAPVLKARLDMQAERHELAAAGFRQALADSPKLARDPGVWLEYADDPRRHELSAAIADAERRARLPLPPP